MKKRVVGGDEIHRCAFQNSMQSRDFNDRFRVALTSLASTHFCRTRTCHFICFLCHNKDDEQYQKDNLR